MITIFHGDATASSRKAYIEKKQATKNPLTFNGDKLILTDLMQVIEGGQLFSEAKNIFIEDFLTKRKAGKEMSEILDFLKNAKEVNIYLWEGKEIDKRKLSQFKNAKILPFKFPQMLFSFLDSLKPTMGRKSIPLFHQSLQSSEPEIVFFMIIRQFRLLLALDEKSATNIDELRTISWQESKLKKQASLFGKEDLVNIYKKLMEIDLGNKTGALNMPLATAIDFFLLSL